MNNQYYIDKLSNINLENITSEKLKTQVSPVVVEFFNTEFISTANTSSKELLYVVIVKTDNRFAYIADMANKNIGFNLYNGKGMILRLLELQSPEIYQDYLKTKQSLTDNQNEQTKI
jgi:hypothetical protein